MQIAAPAIIDGRQALQLHLHLHSGLFVRRQVVGGKQHAQPIYGGFLQYLWRNIVIRILDIEIDMYDSWTN
jgi:hypothetical protein